MKLRILILVIVLTAGMSPRIFAQESNASVQQQYVERCSLTQNYLKNIQKPRDLRARVDRLQAYRYIYQRLDIFVRRLERNNQPEAATLRASLNQFSVKTDAFKNKYEEYDLARESVTQINNCRSNIGSFQQNLQEARNKRQQVNQEVAAIDSLLSPTVSDQLNVLYQQLLTTGTSGVNNE